MMVKNMEPCGDCAALEDEFWRAIRYYVSLVLRQDRMVKDGNAKAGAFENAIQEADSIRASAGRALLTHRTIHWPSPLKTATAGQQ
jgi:hypothetical protein